LANFNIYPSSGTYYGARFQSTAHLWTAFKVPINLTVNQTFNGGTNFVVTSMDLSMLRPSTASPDVRARIWQSNGAHIATSAQSGTIGQSSATPTESNFVNCSFGIGPVLSRDTTYRFGAWANGDIRYGRRGSTGQEVRRELSNDLTSTSPAGTGDAVTVDASATALVAKVNYIYSPSAPTSVTSTGSTTSSVSISWAAPSNNGDSAITGYDVRIGTSNPPTSAWVAKAASATTHTFSSLISGTTYYFQVVAKNAATTAMGTTSLAGSGSRATLAVPTTPTLTITRNGLVYTLSGSSTIISGSITNFEIDRRVTSNGLKSTGSWTATAQPTGSSYNITFTGEPARTYEFRVRAKSDSNIYSSYRTSALQHIPNVPLLPTNPIVLTKNVKKVNVDWDPFTTNANAITEYNGAVISGYQVEARYSSDGGITFTTYSNIASTASGTTVFLTNDLLVAKNYQFRVRANSDVGFSSYQSSGIIFISAYGSRFNGTSFIPIENAKIFIGIGQPGADGAGWKIIENVKRFDGSSWTDLQT
jgi:hypothetical protein